MGVDVEVAFMQQIGICNLSTATYFFINHDHLYLTLPRCFKLPNSIHTLKSHSMTQHSFSTPCAAVIQRVTTAGCGRKYSRPHLNTSSCNTECDQRDLFFSTNRGQGIYDFSIFQNIMWSYNVSLNLNILYFPFADTVENEAFKNTNFFVRR